MTYELLPREFPLGFGSPYGPTVYAEHGSGIYAPGPQPSDLGRGWDQVEPGRPGHLIAESIPHAQTRRLLAQSPAMLHMLEVILDAEKDVISDGGASFLPDFIRSRCEQIRRDVYGVRK